MMSSNNENARSNNNDANVNDMQSFHYDAGGDVLGPRTNALALDTDQPMKPITTTTTRGSLADSGYRTGSSAGVPDTPSLVTPSSTSTSAPTAAISPTLISRGRHGRHEAQDLGTVRASVTSPTRLTSIDEHQASSEETGLANNGSGRLTVEDDGTDALDDIDLTKGLSMKSSSVPQNDTSAQRSTSGQTPISPTTSTSAWPKLSPDQALASKETEPAQTSAGEWTEHDHGLHVPTHREHDSSETAGILRGKKSLAKLDTSVGSYSPVKGVAFNKEAANKPQSKKVYAKTPAIDKEEAASLKLKQPQMKVGMGQPIKQLAIKIRERITGIDERTREARKKARKASIDAKALAKEVKASDNADSPVSKIIHKVKSVSSKAHLRDDGASSADVGKSSKTAVGSDRPKTSKWWPEWQKQTNKGSLDLSDQDEKSLQNKSQKALQAFDKQLPTTSKPYHKIDRTVRYPPRPWPVPSTSGPAGHLAHQDMFYHPDMKPGDPLEKFFYVNKRGHLTPLLLDSRGRPIRFANHSENSSTASNWGRGLQSFVNDFGQNPKKASDRRVKSEADALDYRTNERISSWRRNVDPMSRVAENDGGISPRNNNHPDANLIAQRLRQLSGVEFITSATTTEGASAATERFPSLPSEQSTEYEQSARTVHSQAPGSTSGTGHAQHTTAPQTASNQANLLTVPGASTRSGGRPNSTATDNVPSLIQDQTSSSGRSSSV